MSERKSGQKQFGSVSFGPSAEPPKGPELPQAALENNAKSSSPKRLRTSSKDTSLLSSENRAFRYELQEIARWVLMQKGFVESTTEYAADFHRTCKCLRIPIGTIKVLKDKSYGGTFYGGVFTCGSVWACPVCATKVQERRRLEVKQAIEWAYASGFKCVMVTLTFPHHRHQSLSELLILQARALRRLRSGKAWMIIKGKIGFEGLIRSLEITHGKNSYHCHTHELWIVAEGTDPDTIKEMVQQKWSQACIAAGILDATDANKLLAFQHRAVDIIDFASSSTYLTKFADCSWGADAELAKGAFKTGKNGNRHPFQILSSATPDNEDGRIFVEYATAMIGKRQLYWSPGLHHRTSISYKTDEEIINEAREKADVLAILSRAAWDLVLSEDARTEILDLAQRKGFAGIAAWFLARGLQIFSD